MKLIDNKAPTSETIPPPKLGGTNVYCPAQWRETQGRKQVSMYCHASFGRISTKAFKEFRKHWRRAHLPHRHGFGISK